MNMQMKLRDPTAESSPVRRARLAPPPSLDGKTVALMDIGKSRGVEFLDRLEGHFKKAGVATRRYAKPTNTKVAPVELMQRIAAENQLAVIALSDWGSCTSCSLHDLYNLDGRGLPGVNILTTAFAEGVAAQSDSLGFEPGVVYVPHPIQNRTKAEIETIADQAFDKVMALLKA